MVLRRNLKKIFSKLLSGESFDDKYKNENALTTEDINFIRTIGTGSFSRVYVGEIKKTNQIVAIKRLEKSLLISKKQINHMNNEKAILRLINHPFVITYINSFKDKHYLYLVLEFVNGGDFFTLLNEKKKFTPDQVRFYAAIVAEVFRYMHSKHIIFRDLKPENLLVCSDGYIKFTDFGFAKIVKNRTYTLCGTPEYVAPEILLNQGHGKSVDWWTLGILIYEMLTGFTPFGSNDVMTIYQKILDGKIAFNKGFDEDAKSIIRHLLAHDLTKRYGILVNGPYDVINHRFFSSISFKKLLNKSIKAPIIPEVKNKNDFSRYEVFSEEEKQLNSLTFTDDPFIDW